MNSSGISNAAALAVAAAVIGGVVIGSSLAQPWAVEARPGIQPAAAPGAPTDRPREIALLVDSVDWSRLPVEEPVSTF